ncbi:zinc finger protein 511 [Chiloscyllium plagiosum]|uniref:zinc finger protein 511 n=1 Tax=Chiloscyllium plagiosum TaxID=36176 RepID=UPI001CB7FF0E|nr:zinc finger protein 511 [Chiloscyllium plagiosum]
MTPHCPQVGIYLPQSTGQYEICLQIHAILPPHSVSLERFSMFLSEVLSLIFQYLCLVESCTEKFKASSDRKKHMIKVHGYPSDFRFDKPKKPKCNQKNQSSHDIEMETSSCQKEANDTFCRTSTESMDYAPAETMEADSPSMSEEKSSIPKVQQRPSFSYKVPTTICFGHGSVRGFKNTRKKK